MNVPCEDGVIQNLPVMPFPSFEVCAFVRKTSFRELKGSAKGIWSGGADAAGYSGENVVDGFCRDLLEGRSMAGKGILSIARVSLLLCFSDMPLRVWTE